MGRKKVNRAKRYHEQRRKKRKMQNQDNGDTRVDYDSTVFETNSLFEEFYRNQSILESEEELQLMLKAFKRDLPATIRVYSNSNYYKILSGYLEDLQKQCSANPIKLNSSLPQFVGTDQVFNGPQRIGWYPNQSAWRLGTDRVRLRKDPGLKAFHQYLVREARTENITRQEEVSMIPPLLLEIEPHHRILDTCAAPGSKTAQILEFLHAKEEPSGYLVANDADPRRAYMLHHQLKRFNSPNLLITCCEAQVFPEFKISQVEGQYSKKEGGFFDRILCDVPCSGDGTMRKNIDVWRSWDCNSGNSLHPMQLMILRKSINLLEVGGLLVYSTCTLNPIEDEAVVAQAVRMSKGALEVVDCSDKLKGLKRRAGLTTWKPAVQVNDLSKKKDERKDSKDGAMPGSTLKYFDKLEDFDEFRTTHPLKGGNIKFSKRLHESMFPDEDQEEMKKLGIQNCMRIVPHDQDTGGFFVAVLRKNKPLEPWNGSLTSKTENFEKEEVKSVVSSKSPIIPKEDSKPDEATKLTVSNPDHQKDPQLLPVDEKSWKEASQELDIANADELRECVFYRPALFRGKKMDTKRPKVLTYVSKSLKETFIKEDMQSKLHIIGCGVPILKRSERSKKDDEAGCFKYRLTNDGLSVTSKWIGTRGLGWTFKDFEMFARFSLFKPESEEGKKGKLFCPGVPIERLNAFAREQIEEGNATTMGSYMVHLVEDDEKKFQEIFGSNLKIVVWRARKSISQLIAESELSMLFSQMKDCGLLQGNVVPDSEIEQYYVDLYQIQLKIADLKNDKENE